MESGEKVIAYFDNILFDMNSKGTILLPIGKVVRTGIPVSFNEFRNMYNVDDINTEWYIDMTGTEWQNNVLDKSFASHRTRIFIVTYILSFMVITFILYKCAEIKSGDDLE